MREFSDILNSELLLLANIIHHTGPLALSCQCYVEFPALHDSHKVLARLVI